MGTPDEDFVKVVQVQSVLIRQKVLHVLSIYPKLNPSMLQVGIGTGVAPRLWHPVVDALIAEGLVKKYDIDTVTPTGRSQTSTVIALVAPK
jgi:hypothetical protein